MNEDLLIPTPTEIVKDYSFEFKQEALWNAYPEEPLVVHSSHFGTRSYLDSDLVDEMQVTEDGTLIPGSDKPVITGEYLSHEVPDSDEWMHIPTYTHIHPNVSLESSDADHSKELTSITLPTPSPEAEPQQSQISTMFVNSHINMDTLKVGVPTDIVFHYTEDVNFIMKIQSPCDCTKVYIDAASRTVTVKYTPKEIPVHLKSQGYYTTVKRFEVLFNMKNGLEQPASFSFEAKVVKS